MIKRVQLPSGAIEYVNTNPRILKTMGRKAKSLVKKITFKLTKTLGLRK